MRSWARPPSSVPRRPRSRRAAGLRAPAPFLGPAFIASVAYVDPGNFATNMAAGREVRLPAPLGHPRREPDGDADPVDEREARHRDRPRTSPRCAAPRFPRRVTFLLWVQAEVIAMATDLAEFLGAALGINLLTGLPLFPAAVLTGIAAFAILALQARGFRRLEAVIAALRRRHRGRASGSRCSQADPSWPGAGHGLLVARLRRHRQRPARGGILGATVHAARHLPALGAHPAADRRGRRPMRAGASSASSSSTWSSR